MGRSLRSRANAVENDDIVWNRSKLSELLKTRTGMNPIPSYQAAIRTSTLTVPPLPLAAVGGSAALGNPQKFVKLSISFSNQEWRCL